MKKSLILFLFISFSLFSLGQNDSSGTYTLSHIKNGKTVNIAFDQEVRISDFQTRYRVKSIRVGQDSIYFISQRFGSIALAFYDVEYIKIHKHPIRTIVGGVVQVYSRVGIAVGAVSGIIGTVLFISAPTETAYGPAPLLLVPIGLAGNCLGTLISGKKYKMYKWTIEPN